MENNKLNFDQRKDNAKKQVYADGKMLKSDFYEETHHEFSESTASAISIDDNGNLQFMEEKSSHEDSSRNEIRAALIENSAGE